MTTEFWFVPSLISKDGQRAPVAQGPGHKFVLQIHLIYAYMLSQIKIAPRNYTPQEYHMTFLSIGQNAKS